MGSGDLRVPAFQLGSVVPPDFLLGLLSSFQALNRQNARDTLESAFISLGRLSVYLNSKSELIELRNELSLLETYLSLQKLRFGREFHYHIKLETSENEMLVPRYFLFRRINSTLHLQNVGKVPRSFHVDCLVTREHKIKIRSRTDRLKRFEQIDLRLLE